MWFWGESALPNIAAVVWFLERTGKIQQGEQLLLTGLSDIANRNRQHSENPFPPPEELPDEALASIIGRLKETKPPRGRRAVRSWSLEAYIHLLARRLRRQALSASWSQITDVEMAAFRPNRTADLLLWHCERSEEMTRKAGKPQSWK